MKNFCSIFISTIFFALILCFICIVSIYYTDASISSNTFLDNNYYFSNSEFFWPTPGYHKITSYFGKRNSPTSGASSYHSGIDIAASEGSSIFSVLSGNVVFTGFYGANGHTVIIESNDIITQYSHLSPNYIIDSR